MNRNRVPMTSADGNTMRENVLYDLIPKFNRCQYLNPEVPNVNAID